MSEKTTKDVEKVEPGRSLVTFGDMERWFEEAFRRPFFFPSWLPRLRFPEMDEAAASVDIFEQGENVVVKAELPGMKKEDIDVNLTDDTITISGEKKKKEKVDKKNYHRVERSYGSFSRRLPLPVQVQTDKATAQFKDGVLEITIPKTEKAKEQAKKVTIK